MIEAQNTPTDKIAKAYDIRSFLYDKIVSPSEAKYHQSALNKVDWQPGLKVLEVATGPGRVLSEIAKRLGDGTRVFGLDLSRKMLLLSEKRLQKSGFSQFELKQGDCRRLPWEDDSFDVLYNGYMMDLIRTDEMAGVLSEFKRVLKPGGKLVMINMSKRDKGKSGLEKLYTTLPKFMVLYLMGNCRPVLMERGVRNAGFLDVEREYLSGKHPTEIVTGVKGSNQAETSQQFQRQVQGLEERGKSDLGIVQK